jgi:hypothetical protein
MGRTRNVEHHTRARDKLIMFNCEFNTDISGPLGALAGER